MQAVPLLRGGVPVGERRKSRHSTFSVDLLSRLVGVGLDAVPLQIGTHGAKGCASVIRR